MLLYAKVSLRRKNQYDSHINRFTINVFMIIMDL